MNQYPKIHLKVLVDINGYKHKQDQKIEYLAKKIAKEVLQKKIDVKLDLMNTYNCP